MRLVMMRPIVSVGPPAAAPTTTVIVRVGYDCAPATRGAAASAAALAARCRNRRRGSFMTCPRASPRLTQILLLKKGQSFPLLALSDRLAGHKCGRNRGRADIGPQRLKRRLRPKALSAGRPSVAAGHVINTVTTPLTFVL